MLKGGVVLQKCEKCNASFSWSGLYKSFLGLAGYKSIECANCGAKHKITILGRFTFVALTILPMLIVSNLIMIFTTFHNVVAILGIGLAVLLIGSLLTPYMVRFRIVQP